MRYTFWHLDTGNLIGDFATESAALAAVRDEIHENASPDALVLQRERTGVESEFVASGFSLGQSGISQRTSHAGAGAVTDWNLNRRPRRRQSRIHSPRSAHSNHLRKARDSAGTT